LGLIGPQGDHVPVRAFAFDAEQAPRAIALRDALEHSQRWMTSPTSEPVALILRWDPDTKVDACTNWPRWRVEHEAGTVHGGLFQELTPLIGACWSTAKIEYACRQERCCEQAHKAHGAQGIDYERSRRPLAHTRNGRPGSAPRLVVRKL
jgi:hypothetical protein